ncbi:MAG: hypothetical protein U5L04_07575 [Trueperaceae bacterium]|nr:hypothetical protein [Trueperaceae bacterium]
MATSARRRRDMPEAIETARLELRRATLADAPELVVAVRESLPDLAPWLVWATPDYDEAGCEANLREAVAGFVMRREFRYHLFSKDRRGS